MKKVVVFLIFTFIVCNLLAQNSLAAVGETYNEMAKRHGTPEQVRFHEVENTARAAKYEKAGAKIYIFKISGVKLWNLPGTGEFKVYAEFNSNNICFKLITLHNQVLPYPSLFIGKLANTKPKVLHHTPRRSITLQYGEGENAVIFHSQGLPGRGDAYAISRALEPK